MLDFQKTVAPAGTADQATILTLKDGQIRHLRRFVLQASAGSVAVFGSADGTNYPVAPLVLSLEPAVDGALSVTETQGTFVAKTSGTRLHYFFGQYKSLKFVQQGGTAAGIRVYGSMD